MFKLQNCKIRLPYETVPNSNLGTSNCRVGAVTEPLQAFRQHKVITQSA